MIDAQGRSIEYLRVAITDKCNLRCRYCMPACRQGILAGFVLAFARALGEYGATSMLIGYTPGKTATISTTVYQLYRTNDDAGALFWVLVNLAISAVVLLTVNLLEARQKKAVSVK